jgi:serine phosphatase RsbU (regulator of sigma subunit)
VYSALSDYKKAIEFYLQAQKIYEELHKTNTVQYVNTLYNLATAYKGMENYKQALEVYQRSLELYQKLGDEGGVSIALLEIGSIFKDSHLFEDFSKALKYYFQALPLFEKANDVNNLALLYFNIGAIYRAQENYQKAKLYTEKSLRIAQDNGLLKHIFEAESLLNVIYEDLHDYRKALMHYKNFVQLKDSTLNEESMKQVSGLEFKIKENEIRLEHQKEQIRAEAELRHQKTIRYAFTIGFGLVLILAFVILWSLRQTRIKNKIIEQQKAEVETQHQLIEHKQKEILDSITYARRIQHALLASENLLNENLSDYFVLFKPKDIVSGDFYWASRHNELFYIIAADSTGHGVPGAFMSLLNISFLNDALAEKQIKEPNQILNHVRENLIRSLKDDGSAEGGQDGMDCVLCSFDFSGLTLDYAAANNSFYILRNRELIVCKADKMPVGKSPKDGVSFEVRRVDLQKGDIVYIFTDGLPDQFGGPKGKKLKYKPFEEKLIEICGLPMPEQKPLLDKMFEDWRGEYEQVDDVLVIGVKI